MAPFPPGLRACCRPFATFGELFLAFWGLSAYKSAVRGLGALLPFIARIDPLPFSFFRPSGFPCPFFLPIRRWPVRLPSAAIMNPHLFKRQ